MTGRQISSLVQIGFAVMCGMMSLLILSAPSAAQTVTATLTGTVSDPGGAVLPNARVIASNSGTGLQYSAQTNVAGVYTLPFLPIGRYVVSVEASGFKRLVSRELTLEVNQTARLDLHLELGELSQTVTVESAAPVLQTENVTVGHVVSGNTTTNLPLNGRNFQQLTLLVPGAISPDPNGFNQVGGGGRPYTNGNREQGNSFLLDGITLSETINDYIGLQPNVDALGEVRIETSNSSAEFGNVTGATVNATLKSGTNQFRGNVFEFLRNDALDANTWRNNRDGAGKAKLRQNIFGGTIGGPVIRDRIFFFADYQGVKRRTGGGASGTVAPVEWRTGNLSSISTPIIDPLTGKQFPGNIIAQNRIVNPVAKALFADPKIYPLPTRPGTSNISGNYTTTTSDGVDAYQFDVRIDARLTERDNFSGRYSFGNSENKGLRGLFPVTPANGIFSRPQNIALNHVHTFSPTVINEARIGFNRAVLESRIFDWGGIGRASEKFGIAGTQPIDGLSRILPGSGVNGVGSRGADNNLASNTFHYGDNLTILRGRHSLKMGGQWLRYQQNEFYPGNNGLLGFFQYTGRFTGVAFADFLLDLLSAKGRGSQTGTWGHRQNRIGAFFQDDYKLRNNLTVNLGMRWEYTSPLVEVKDRQVNFDIRTGRLLRAGQDGNSRALYNPYYKGFEPRLGFAWTPEAFNNKLVVRGGYGITQYMEGTGANLRLPLNPPYFFESDVSYNLTTGPGSIAQGFAGVIGRNEIAGLIRIWNPDLRPQFTQQYNLTLEYLLTPATSVSAGYVGHTATHLIAPTDWNQPLPGTGAPSTWLPSQQRRPLYSALPNVTAISGTDSSAISNYNSLQIGVRQRAARGLEFLASYTLSKTLTDNIGYYGSDGVGDVSFYQTSFYNRRADYGPAFFDARHNFVWAGSYELPVGRGRAWGQNWHPAVNALLGGWSVSSIISLHSGFPLTFFADDLSLQDPRGGVRANLVTGPQITSSGGLQKALIAGSAVTTGGYFNLAAFSQPALGSFGTSGVGIARAPGYANWDFSLGKKFYVTEARYFDFRAEFFNFTNHPSFRPPSTYIGDPDNFGKIFSTISPPRILEFALKFYF